MASIWCLSATSSGDGRTGVIVQAGTIQAEQGGLGGQWQVAGDPFQQRQPFSSRQRGDQLFFSATPSGWTAYRSRHRVRDLLVVRSLFGGLIKLGLPRKQARQTDQGLIAPAGQEIAMEAMFGRDLVEGLFFFQHLAHELGFECRSVLFPHSE